MDDRYQDAHVRDEQHGCDEGFGRGIQVFLH